MCSKYIFIWNNCQTMNNIVLFSDLFCTHIVSAQIMFLNKNLLKVELLLFIVFSP